MGTMKLHLLGAKTACISKTAMVTKKAMQKNYTFFTENFSTDKSHQKSVRNSLESTTEALIYFFAHGMKKNNNEHSVNKIRAFTKYIIALDPQIIDFVTV